MLGMIYDLFIFIVLSNKTTMEDTMMDIKWIISLTEVFIYNCWLLDTFLNMWNIKTDCDECVVDFNWQQLSTNEF